MAVTSPVSRLKNQPLSQDQLTFWDEQGYLLLPGLIEPELIAAQRAMFSEIVDELLGGLKAMGKISDTMDDLPLERRLTAAAANHLGPMARAGRGMCTRRATYDLHYAPGLVAVMRQLMGSPVVATPVYNGRPKLPGQRATVVPWHQDVAYFGDACLDQTILTVWIPWVPVDESNGCMQVAAGSHKNPLLAHGQEQDEGQYLFMQDYEPAAKDIITFPMQPGDALIFNSFLAHRSLPSVADCIRWSTDVRYIAPIHEAKPPTQFPHDPSLRWVVQSDDPAQPVYDDFPRWQKANGFQRGGELIQQ